MAISTEYYRIFYYVAKYRSLTRAAAALLSNQPNVSRAMKQLEHALGCPLLVRSHRGVTLTAEGEQLYAHVAIAFDHLQQGEAELARSAGLQSGTVSLGVSETALHLCLLERLALFRRRHPGVRLKLYNYTTPQALAALRSGQIDFAAVTTPVQAAAPLRTVRLAPFEDILAGGPPLKAFARQPRSLRELAPYPLVCLGKNTGTYEFFNRFYLDCGLVLEPDIEVATADLVLPMLASGLGVGFLPRPMAQAALTQQRIFEIHLQEAVPGRWVCLVHDPKRGLGIAARTLKRALCQGEEAAE